jgi:hypothetical protein
MTHVVSHTGCLASTGAARSAQPPKSFDDLEGDQEDPSEPNPLLD